MLFSVLCGVRYKEVLLYIIKIPIKYVLCLLLYYNIILYALQFTWSMINVAVEKRTFNIFKHVSQCEKQVRTV